MTLRESHKPTPTPITEVAIAKVEITHINNCTDYHFAMLLNSLTNSPTSTLLITIC